MADNRISSGGGSLLASEKIKTVITTPYIALPSDNGKTIFMTNGSAMAFTVPQDPSATTAGDTVAVEAFPDGWEVRIIQGGAGAVTITAGSGATVHGVTVATSAQYGTLGCFKAGASTYYARA